MLFIIGLHYFLVTYTKQAILMVPLFKINFASYPKGWEEKHPLLALANLLDIFGYMKATNLPRNRGDYPDRFEYRTVFDR